MRWIGGRAGAQRTIPCLNKAELTRAEEAAEFVRFTWQEFSSHSSTIKSQEWRSTFPHEAEMSILYGFTTILQIKWPIYNSVTNIGQDGGLKNNR